MAFQALQDALTELMSELLIRLIISTYLYYNWKGYYTVNVMLVCDHELRHQYVDASHPGACHDSFIWNTSELIAYLEQEYLRNGSNYWLLGGAGYSLEPWLITPHRCPQDGSVEIKFNEFHSKCRNVIERTNDVLKNRWRCLLGARELYYAPEKAAKITNVCIYIKCNMEVNYQENVETPSVQDDDVISLASLQYLAVAQNIRNNIGNNL